MDGKKQMIAVEVATTPTFAAGVRRPLFDVSAFFNNPWLRSFSVFPGDKAFLMLQLLDADAAGGPNAGRTILVRNWLPEIRAKLKGR